MADDQIMMILLRIPLLIARFPDVYVARGHQARQESSRRKTTNKYECLPPNNTCPPVRNSTIQGINWQSGAQAPRRSPGGPPEAKKMRNMRENMPENQVETKSAFKRHPNLEKVCIRMPSDVLEKKRAFIYLKYNSIFSRKYFSILPCTGSICESIHSQIDSPSSGRSSKLLSPGAAGVLGVYQQIVAVFISEGYCEYSPYFRVQYTLDALVTAK